VTGARYDAIAEFYTSGWTDTYDDSVSVALFELLGQIEGLRVLDVACGHGRVTRELARRGARVVGVDLSAALLDTAKALEARQPLGIEYVQADVASDRMTGDGTFDAVTCSFGLSDIDDLEGCVRRIATALRPGGRFVFSVLHPCFPGSGDTSGSWPSSATYYDEGWWAAAGRDSSLRRQVGANHRTLSTYINTFRAHQLSVDAVIEPAPPPEWREQRPSAATFPVFLAARCLKQ
jgi:2-polyprenyl-3-methyl-5-hydroxy-6-metoxy-1,4-benzoquinol methylase